LYWGLQVLGGSWGLLAILGLLLAGALVCCWGFARDLPVRDLVLKPADSSLLTILQGVPIAPG
jgi:hypothetical protein